MEVAPANQAPRILGVIPARGGSKGVPRKNILPVAGKPLIAWSIDAAKESRRLTRWVVSTEDAEIARTASDLGATIIWRPAELASDEASTLHVLQHALEESPAEIVVLLQPTSPVRGRGLVDACIEKFLTAGVDSLGTVHRDFGYEYGLDMPRRQEMTPRLLDNGNVYVIGEHVIREGRWIGDRIEVFEISREEGVDVDEEFDLWLAEQILLYREPRRWNGQRIRGAECR